MENQIPTIVEELYHTFVGEPKPFLWSENLQEKPLWGHGLWAFYRGLQVGLQIAAACLGQG